MTIIKDMPFTLTREDVIRGLGMGSNNKLRPEIDRLVDRTLVEVLDLKLIHPTLAYEIIQVLDMGTSECRLAGGAVFRGETIPRLLSRAGALAPAVVTIGPELEARVTSCFTGGRRLQGLIYDAMGSEVIENLRFAIQRIMQAEAGKRGWTTSSPVSPGGPAWPLSEQFTLFSLVPAAAIGVRLSTTAMMMPRKSGSMVFGLGESMPTWSLAERCDMCARGANCPYRNHPENSCETVRG